MTTRVEYIIGDNILDIINKAAYEHCSRADIQFGGASPDKQFELYTGMAGYHQFDKAINDMCLTSGLVIKASDIGIINGKEVANGFSIYTAPFLGTFKCLLDTTLDHLEEIGADLPDNPIINGWRTSSYSYRLNDMTTGDTIDIIATGMRKPSGPLKYYWVHYKDEQGEFPFKPYDIVVDIHPFQWKKSQTLINWKEITKEEYNLFNKLNPQD